MAGLDSVRQLFQDLRLDQLIAEEIGANRDIVPLKAQETLASARQTTTKIILGHNKTWKKPSHAVLKERYGSNPHNPPVLDPSKLVKLADPLRGKFAAFDRLMSEDDDGDDVDYRYKQFDLSAKRAFASPSSSQQQQRVGAYPPSGSRTNNGNSSKAASSSLSPDKEARSSAFFLTAAGSDDDNDNYRPRRVAGTGTGTGGTGTGTGGSGTGTGGSAFAASQGPGRISRVRGKLDEARRLGAVKERLTKPVLGRRAAAGLPGLQRQKSGRFASAPSLGLATGAGTRPAAGNRRANKIKSSIPPQQPLPKRRLKEAPFGVHVNSGVGAKGARRGMPGTGPMGLGLDTSNLSSNGGGNEERARQARRRTSLSSTGAAERSQCTIDIASGGGTSAARIRAGRSLSGLSGVKSAPAALARLDEGRGRPGRGGQVPGVRSALSSSNRPAVPISGVSDRAFSGRAARAASGGAEKAPGGASGYGYGMARRKSVTIDPSLSPLRQAGSAGGGGAGMWQGVGRTRRDDAPANITSPRVKGAGPSLSPRGKSGQRDDRRDGSRALSTPALVPPPAPSAHSLPVDVDAIRSTLDRIQAQEAVRALKPTTGGGGGGGAGAGSIVIPPSSTFSRAPQGRGPVAKLGTPLPESAAALLAQHARRLSSHLDQARTLASQYDAESNNPVPFSKDGGLAGVNMNAFLPKRSQRAVDNVIVPTSAQLTGPQLHTGHTSADASETSDGQGEEGRPPPDKICI